DTTHKPGKSTNKITDMPATGSATNATGEPVHKPGKSLKKTTGDIVSKPAVSTENTNTTSEPLKKTKSLKKPIEDKKPMTSPGEPVHKSGALTDPATGEPAHKTKSKKPTGDTGSTSGHGSGSGSSGNQT